MFRFFLTNKIFSAENRPVAQDARPNRRMTGRFPFDHRRMTMMSDQDIMVVREVSETGFSSIVSERTWSRMNVGDGYSSRLRIGPELLEFTIRVAWKDSLTKDSFTKDSFTKDSFVKGSDAADPGQTTWLIGFEMVTGENGVPAAWQRLIRPAALASSLQRVESSFMHQFGSEKSWYHGDDGCDLMIWSPPDGGDPFAWRLSFDSHFVEWREGLGFETGRTPDLTPGVPGDPASLALPGMPRTSREPQVVADRRRLVEALDILSASAVDEAPALIRLLEWELAKNDEKRRPDVR
ncbi:hypothetical protein EBZ80_14430 [bacterium]|nr:hypothetical protein [bacterium]